MEPSRIPMVPPRLPPINQGNINLVENNQRTSPLSYEDIRSPNWREHQYTPYEDDDDEPREGLGSSWSPRRAEQLWANNNPEESVVGDEAFYLRECQSTQPRFGLPPLIKNTTQHQLRSKSIDQLPCASYQGPSSRPRSRDSTQAQSGSIVQETEEWDGEFDPEAIGYFRSLTPVEIEWRPPTEQGELSPLSDTDADLASIYLPSLLSGARRSRSLTPFPDADIHTDSAEETIFRLSVTPQQMSGSGRGTPYCYTTNDRSQILKIRHGKQETPEDEQYHEEAYLGPLSPNAHFENEQEMRMDAEAANELRSTPGSTSTERSDRDVEYSYQDIEDSDQDLENSDKNLVDSDKDCDADSEDSDQEPENPDQNLDESDQGFGDPNDDSKVKDQGSEVTGHNSKEPDQTMDKDHYENDTEKNLKKKQLEEAKKGLKSKIKSFISSKFKAHLAGKRDEAPAAQDDPEEDVIASGDNLQRREGLETELTEAELALNRELETAWEKYEHEQYLYFRVMNQIREEQESANRWRLGALQHQLSYAMLKAELDEKREEAGVIDSP